MQPQLSYNHKKHGFSGHFFAEIVEGKKVVVHFANELPCLDKRRLFRLLLKMGIPTNCKVFLQQHSFFSSNNHGDSARFFLKGHFA